MKISIEKGTRLLLTFAIIITLTISASAQKLGEIKDASTPQASEEKKGFQLPAGLDIRGFFDFKAANFEVNPNFFQFGDFELDIDHTFNRNIKVVTATVVNVTLPVPIDISLAYADFYIWGSSTKSTDFPDDGIHIRAGKFDLMFGNDWRYYTADLRMTVTAPLTHTYVISGPYNDLGLQFLANFNIFNASVYVLKGKDNGTAYETRIAVTPVKDEKNRIEIGLSYLIDLNPAFQWQFSSYALDFELFYGPVIVQAEYYIKDKENYASPYIRDGFQLLGGYDLGNNFNFLPLIVFVRWDAARARNNTLFDIFSHSGAFSQRITAGLNFKLLGFAILKFEYSQLLVSNTEFKTAMNNMPDTSIYGQIVIKF